MADAPTPAASRIEGMLFQPTGAYTVTNTFGTNQYGEVGLAVGTTPLLQNTEVAAPGSAEAAAVVADNAKRAVTLDDGASTNFTASSFSARDLRARARAVPAQRRPDPGLRLHDQAGPGRRSRRPSRAPVVVDYRFNLWRFQPTAQVVGPDNATARR